MIRLPIVLLIFSVLGLFAQTPPPAAAPSAQSRKEEDKPVVTKHSIQLGGKTLSYTVTTGMMPIKTDSGETEANMFFMAYTVERPAGSPLRPLTFSFNGGPGSASVWLHMGALGPRRVKLNDDGSLPPPPYRLVDNEATWLDLTDIVFIDPVNTGFSRATKPELTKKFLGLDGDIASIGEFIRLYLTRNERWTSPLFLAGESYGTTRAAGLAGHLIDRGIALNGIVLLSTVLNFQTLLFTKSNDLPFELILPSYTATAWYHKKLPPDLQKDLHKALAESEAWALGGYTEILAKGDGLSASERDTAITKLSRLTGLSQEYIGLSNLRVEIHHFIKELLRDKRETVGRLDSRLKGTDAFGTAERAEFDPAIATIRPPYTATFAQYVREDLGYQTDQPYFILGEGVRGWEWGANNSFADTSDPLRSAFSKNPYMKLFVGYGYFDLATPYLAAQYTLSHAGFPAGTRKNITEKYYDAGHMFYIELQSLHQLKKDIAEFLKNARPTP
ncbi:MAG: peptidase S10 [Bryobacteraceae bacterium]